MEDQMKKMTLISLAAIATLWLMSNKAWAEDDKYDAYVQIYNSTEVPIPLSLLENNNAKARFPNDSEGWILQPGDSTYLTSTKFRQDDAFGWNIIYTFYDGTPSINQRVEFNYGTRGTNCANPSQSGNFYASEGTFVDEHLQFHTTGGNIASAIGLHGTAKNVVGGLIDLGMLLANKRPKVTTTEELCYLITIGQTDYNTAMLANVAWDDSSGGSIPPPVTFVVNQQLMHYYGGNHWYCSQYMSNSATIAETDVSGNTYVGTQESEVYGFFNGDYISLNGCSFDNTNAIVRLSCAPGSTNIIESYIVAALSDGSIWFSWMADYNLNELSPGWDSAILQMCVNWNALSWDNFPQIVVGLANGAVEYFDNTSWRELHNTGWGTCVMKLVADWGDDGSLQNVVAGLGNGTITWYNKSVAPNWMTLSDISFNNPVYQLDARFHGTNYPYVVAGLFNGAIIYATNFLPDCQNWIEIEPYGLTNNYCIIDLGPTNLTFPTLVAGFKNGSVQLYDGNSGRWSTLQEATTNRVQYISAYWPSFRVLDAAYSMVNCLFCENYQFTYITMPEPEYVFNYFNYPAIPSTDSLCGDLDGDGRDDLVTTDDSKWYIWYSEGEHLARSGPYDLGIGGTPLVGDVDGDGQDDFVMVDNTSWHAWLSSMRHNWHSQRIGPCGLGIHGTPLLGDIDGDVQKDLIMVMGSLWYIWPSSLGYTQRIGPFDLGIHGLPATGDINGDGLADLIIVKGSDWYVCYSISPGQYSPWCGPYNMGISGAPTTGDINGDGLADLIIVVGSDWYVSFSISPGQYSPWYGPFTKSVL